MYSVVLAAMLTTTPATPSWGCHGCHGCHGCWSCYGCHGCWGCCGGCYGCYGGWGGYYGWGGYGYGWGYGYPAYSWTTSYGYGWTGAFGCAGGMYACVGCYGGYGWGYYASAAPVIPAPVAGVAAPGAPAAAAEAAMVQVRLPENARLFVEGQPVKLDGGRFVTPRLQPGQLYEYTLKTETVRDGQVVTQSKEVRVRAGETTRVAFGGAEAATASRITVRLPENAKLYVNGVLLRKTSATRSFETPPLEPGSEYSYTLKAEVEREGQTVTASKKVAFKGGDPVRVDFGDMRRVQTASR